MRLRKISEGLAKAGYLNERGRPCGAKSVHDASIASSLRGKAISDPVKTPCSSCKGQIERLEAYNSASPRSALGRRLALIAAPGTFALVGASSTAIDVTIFWVLVQLVQVPPLFANAISYSTGAINSFLLNKFVTFRARNTRRGSGEQLALFVVVRIACLVIASLVIALALPFMPSLAAKLVSIVVTFVVAYALSSRLVFR